MPYFFCLDALLLLALAAVRFFRATPRLARAAGIVNAAVCAAGGAAMLCAALLFSHDAAAVGGETEAWARDAFGLWARMAGVFTAAAGGALLLAALIRHKMTRTRTAVFACGALILLGAGYAYAATCRSSDVDAGFWALVYTLGCAALLGAGNAVDLLFSPAIAPRSAKKRRRL